MNKSLASALEAFVGETISVETADGRVYGGILDSVDKDMNVMLGKAKCKYVDGPRRFEILPSTEFVLLSAKNIRYYHFPPQSDVRKQMRAQEKRTKRASHKRSVIVETETRKRRLENAE